MTERLLQHIWQFQHFNTGRLVTVEAEPLMILSPGSFNTHQGPDFLDAKIRIGNTTWAGNIELHISSSHWNSHRHDEDRNYRNVILHVVWRHDPGVKLPFPTLELQDRVSKLLLGRYETLMNSPGFIPCEKNILKVDPLVITSLKERMMVERLMAKSKSIFQYQEKNNHNWIESFWWLLSKNFGSRVNGESFEKIAMSVPVHILFRHKSQLLQLEALLFGQAGLLDHSRVDDYPRLLKREYLFLKKKYGLKNPGTSLMFLRMRPSNFPTVRLAQLAMLVHQSLHLFSRIVQTDSLKEIRKLLNTSASEYWNDHYVFDVRGTLKIKHLGRQMRDSLLVNTVIPMVFAHGVHHADDRKKEKALQWFFEIPVEKNSVSRGFETLGLSVLNAFDSQAYLQLKNDYCSKKRCLDCSIGNKLMGQFISPVPGKNRG